MAWLTSYLDAKAAFDRNRHGSVPWVLNPRAWRNRIQRVSSAKQLHRLKHTALLRLRAELKNAIVAEDYEKAAMLRDQIKELKRMMGGEPADVKAGGTTSYRRGKGRKRGGVNSTQLP